MSPSQNWRRQIEGRTQSLPAAPVRGGSSSIVRLHLLPACRTAAENMASSFHDFHAEFIAGSSPDDSHLALETIFSCFSFSTYSWRVPAIYVVSPPLAPLARSTTRWLLRAGLAPRSSLLCTAKPITALLRSIAAVCIATKIGSGKKTNQGKTNTLQVLGVFAKPLSGWLGKGLMVWTHEQIAKLKAHTHNEHIQRQLGTTEPCKA